MQDSCCVIKVLIQLTKLLPKPNLFHTEMIKIWYNESKAFSISIVIENSSLLKMLVISVMSAINLPLSPVNLFLPYTTCVCCNEIKLGRTFLSRDARALDIIL